MGQEAERIVVDDDYLRALGRATYNFAYLEWGIVWLCEKLLEGKLQEAKTKTAGGIAKDFSNLLSEHNGPTTNDLTELAASFNALVQDRNRLMHGNPYSDKNGEQQLGYDGNHGQKNWSLPDLLDFADRAASASVEAGRLLPEIKNSRIE